MNVKQKMKMQIRVKLTTTQIPFRIAHFGVLKIVWAIRRLGKLYQRITFFDSS